LYSIEPTVANRVFNLLTKDDCRAALADEVIPRRPKMAGIVGAFLATGGAEGLTGATTCPNRSVIGPAGESEGVGPSADSGEEVALSVFGEFIGVDFCDATFVHDSRCDQRLADERPQPVGSVWVVFVVVVHRWLIPLTNQCSEPAPRWSLTSAFSIFSV
jgi:hypothetical protein